ncbi:MAG: MOSC domain-containing protein [Pararhodobacter sp.]
MTAWQPDLRTPHAATRQELDRALPFIAAAPRDDAPIDMLCLRPDFGERRFVSRIDVTREQGIPGERWGSHPWLRLADGRPHPGIQICILSRRVLDLVWRDRAGTVHPGDTFIVDMDLSEANLPAGQRLRAGSAVLEVSDIFNDACVKWKARYGAPTQEWVRAPENRALRLRGILCRVVVDGVITLGDRLSKA